MSILREKYFIENLVDENGEVVEKDFDDQVRFY
jgi:hypothetical protein